LVGTQLRRESLEETLLPKPISGNPDLSDPISAEPALNLVGDTNAISRRQFVHSAMATAAGLVLARRPAFSADEDLAIRREIEKQRQETLQRLRQWVSQPSIAAENKGMGEGCELTMQLLRDSGFEHVEKVATKGQPVIFATLDAGAPRTLALYFMYDVKQVDPAEWSTPPFSPTLVDKPGIGKVLVGRGAVNQKGPQNSFLAALHAIQGAGRKLPVNLVLLAEGEEEIGSEHLPDVVTRSDVQAALKRSMGIFMPDAAQDMDGSVTLPLGAKGDIEVELIASGENWGRGPTHDIHSSNAARVDNPAWRLVHALATLVSPDGSQPAIDNFYDKVRPLSAGDRAMIAEAAERFDEETFKKELGVSRWLHDASWPQALELLISQPTVSIEGLVGGYTGPGGKTVLPHRAAAKIDMRLVPDMTVEHTLAALKSHLARRGFGDIEVRVNGGMYGPTTSPGDSALIRTSAGVYREMGINPVILPRQPGSWPGFVFTDPPLQLPASHFGLGHGSGAHAPNEYYLIDSSDPKVQGMDGAIVSYVKFLYELAQAS
jgi:acetylornithine deacetylase/succinyl-diaminopimelate desuccinylase-like protein